MERANRYVTQLNCRRCDLQDYANRTAAVCVVQNYGEGQYGTVRSLETLPQAWRVRRAASGRDRVTDSHTHMLRSVFTDRTRRRKAA
jgi:uncharacterized protein YbdZ (MbtH family)